MKRFAGLSLHDRLLLVALLPAALVASLVTSLVVHRGTRALDDALDARGRAIASFLAPASEYGVITGNRASLETLLQGLSAQPDLGGVAIYGGDGELLASRGRFRAVPSALLRKTDRVHLVDADPEVLAVLAPVFPSEVVIDDLLAGEPMVDARKVRPAGWVYVELDALPATRQKNSIISVTLALLAIGLGTAGLLSVRLARSVSKPVSRLVAGVEKMADGSLDVQLPERATNAELAALERGFNAMARAISEMHRTMQSRIDEATAKLAHLAHHDALTGLPNRRAFEQHLEESVAASRRAGDHGALCFIDLDRFKLVNDTCGHAAGDELLRHIARLLRQRLREEDVVCRVGGDEFAVILRGCTRSDALRIAENLREGLAAFRFECEGRRFSVGASIGLIHIDGKAATPSEILMAADLACYTAKKNGRNQVVEHEPGQPVPTEYGNDALRKGLPTDPDADFVLYAQAIVPLARNASGQWLEVLLRVRDGQGQLQAPGAYLSRLEDSGRALDVDLEVAASAFAAAASRSGAATFSVSLNVSRRTLMEGTRFVEQLARLAVLHGIAPARIVLELPGQLVEQLPAESRHLADKARGAGFCFAIQGLDGSGFRHLPALRPDYVKISLYRLIAAFGMEAGCNLAQALASMASSLGIHTVATEVEDPVLLEALSAYGFDYAQGHSVSSPVPIERWETPHPPEQSPATPPLC